MNPRAMPCSRTTPARPPNGGETAPPPPLRRAESPVRWSLREMTSWCVRGRAELNRRAGIRKTHRESAHAPPKPPAAAPPQGPPAGVDRYGSGPPRRHARFRGDGHLAGSGRGRIHGRWRRADVPGRRPVLGCQQHPGHGQDRHPWRPDGLPDDRPARRPEHPRRPGGACLPA